MRNFTLATLVVAGSALAVGASPTAAEAQGFGVQIGIADDLGFGFGGRFMTDIDAFADDDGSVLQELRFIADFLYYIDPFEGCDACSAFEVNANAAVPLDVGEADVYAGAGFNYTRTSIDIGIDVPGFGSSASGSDVGLNILGGLNFPLGSLSAFAEAAVTLGGAEQLGIKGGILVGGGGD